MSRIPTTILVFVVVAACQVGCDRPRQPAPESDEALMKRLEQQAASRPPRASISFGFTHELRDIEQGGPIRVEADDGTSVRITGAWLVVSALEAHLCEPELTRNKGTWLDRAGDWLVPSAHAHVPNSATRLGVPFVEDLLGEGGKARIVGEVAPPLGDYCSFYAVVSPADDDVLNLTELSTMEAEGNTLILRGVIDPDGEAREFTSASAQRDVVEFPAIDPNTGQTPLALDEPQATQMILLSKTVSRELFANITVDQFTTQKAASIVLDRLEPTFRVERFDSPSKQ
jgi:hypothetical protein